MSSVVLLGITIIAFVATWAIWATTMGYVLHRHYLSH